MWPNLRERLERGSSDIRLLAACRPIVAGLFFRPYLVLLAILLAISRPHFK
jgi:hypothetical protein